MSTKPPTKHPKPPTAKPTAGPSRPLPDPLETAQREAERINADRQAWIYSGLERILTDARWVDRQRILDRVTAYHREAMSKVPSFTKYPEAKPWVEYVLAVDRELRRLANLTDEEIALYRSLSPYMTFRGYKEAGAAFAAPPTAEKCRVAFLPETDHGALHIKNVDDPITWWKPDPPLPARAPREEFAWTKAPFLTDGVGSGLHIDDEPAELFPVPVLQMMRSYADDTPGVVEFIRRYSPFWSGANLLVFDRKYRSVAIEKCSRHFCEVFGPNEHGHVHISGMTCRNPNSPQGRHQQAKRDEYRRLFRLPEGGPDDLFWKTCRKFEEMLANGLRQFGSRPKATDVIKLFVTPWTNGLNKAGLRLHPAQGLVGYTLITRASLLEKDRDLRWQRSQDGKTWPKDPEVCQYE